MRHGQRPDLIQCGSDVRQYGITPEDDARASAIVAQYGGYLEMYPVGTASVVVRWIGDTGQTLTATAQTSAAAIRHMRSLLSLSSPTQTS